MCNANENDLNLSKEIKRDQPKAPTEFEWRRVRVCAVFGLQFLSNFLSFRAHYIFFVMWIYQASQRGKKVEKSSHT